MLINIDDCIGNFQKSFYEDFRGQCSLYQPQKNNPAPLLNASNLSLRKLLRTLKVQKGPVPEIQAVSRALWRSIPKGTTQKDIHNDRKNYFDYKSNPWAFMKNYASTDCPVPFLKDSVCET